jgi:hypothetical protein
MNQLYHNMEQFLINYDLRARVDKVIHRILSGERVSV